LEHEEPSLPTPKILASLGQVTFFMSSLHHRLLLLSNNIRGKKGDNLVIILDWQVD